MRDIVDYSVKSPNNINELDSYFAQARSWYIDAYVEHTYERAIMLLFTFVGTTAVVAGVYYGMPIHDRVSYLIKSQNYLVIV